jgi:hypothetical protein
MAIFVIDAPVAIDLAARAFVETVSRADILRP